MNARISSVASEGEEIGSPSETQLRPCTPNMMKPVRLSLNRNDLSPRNASCASLWVVRNDSVRVTEIRRGGTGNRFAHCPHQAQDREYNQSCENASAGAEKARGLRVPCKVEESRDRDVKVGVRQEAKRDRAEGHQ